MILSLLIEAPGTLDAGKKLFLFNKQITGSSGSQHLLGLGLSTEQVFFCIPLKRAVQLCFQRLKRLLVCGQVGRIIGLGVGNRIMNCRVHQQQVIVGQRQRLVGRKNLSVELRLVAEILSVGQSRCPGCDASDEGGQEKTKGEASCNRPVAEEEAAREFLHHYGPLSFVDQGNDNPVAFCWGEKVKDAPLASADWLVECIALMGINARSAATCCS